MSNVIQFQPLHPENPFEEIHGRTYRRALTGKAAQQSYAARVKNHLARPEAYPQPDAQDARGARRQAKQAAKAERKKHRRGFVRRELGRERVASDLKFFFSIYDDVAHALPVRPETRVVVATSLERLAFRAIDIDLKERQSRAKKGTEVEPISWQEALARLRQIASRGTVATPKEKRYDQGGTLQSGLTLVENRTRQAEPVLNYRGRGA